MLPAAEFSEISSPQSFAPAMPRPASAPAVVGPGHLVLPGDFPDPTIARVGGRYWASATTAEWGGVFPLLCSDDLIHWEQTGHVFPDGLPPWAGSNAWAPEIFEEEGRVYLFYTARRKGGVLTVAVASADRPEGPYRDHGPLVGQRAGSIDGCPVRDEHGVLWLVWKEDGNSCHRPTPLFAQRLSADRTKLVGKKVELFRNDPASWEGTLVEGSSFQWHEGYLYMFYAGNACCGKLCTYATGVARAQSLLGHWEKCPQNPILANNSAWKCAGHGTPITTPEGRHFLLHHAYSVMSHEFVGRQGLLSEFTFGPDGWPHFVGRSPQAPAPEVRDYHVVDDFAADAPSLHWQWPLDAPRPDARQRGGRLSLPASRARLGSLLARRTTAATYRAAATLDLTTLPHDTRAGIAAVGDPYNALTLTAQGGYLHVNQVRAGKVRRLAVVELPADAAQVTLRLEAWGGMRYRFAYSLDAATWEPIETEGYTVNGTYLPPWDRGVRVALLAQGDGGTEAAFTHFAIVNQR